MSDPLLGSMLDGRYQITEKLGDGGMGMVYKALQVNINREVAIKVLHPHLLGNDQLMKRFHREATTCSRLEHPNAIRIYDFGNDGSHTFLVMEYIDGDDLEHLLSLTGAISVAQVAALNRQVCAALAEAHSLSIVHRDLKPSNIMISKKRDGSQQVKVVDFGIAKVLDSSEKLTRMTQTGMVIGTLAYMSPEQASGEQIDLRSDIYSLGIILYELLTGETPFRASTPYEVMNKHITEKPKPLRKFRPDLNIPAGVEKVVMKALEKDPARRHQHITDLQKEMTAAVTAATGEALPAVHLAPKKAIEPTEIATAAIPGTEVDAARPPERGKRPNARPALIYGAFAAAALAVLIAVYFFFIHVSYGFLVINFTPHGADIRIFSPTVSQEQIQLVERPPADINEYRAVSAGYQEETPGALPPLLTYARYRLPAGEYTISLSKEGYRGDSRDVVIEAGGTETIDIHLEQEIRYSQMSVHVDPPDARLTVEALQSTGDLLTAAEKVQLVDQRSGTSTYRLLPGFRYRITVTKQNYLGFSHTVDAKEGSPPNLTFNLNPRALLNIIQSVRAMGEHQAQVTLDWGTSALQLNQPPAASGNISRLLALKDITPFTLSAAETGIHCQFLRYFGGEKISLDGYITRLTNERFEFYGAVEVAKDQGPRCRQENVRLVFSYFSDDNGGYWQLGAVHDGCNEIIKDIVLRRMK